MKPIFRSAWSFLHPGEIWSWTPVSSGVDPLTLPGDCGSGFHDWILLCHFLDGTEPKAVPWIMVPLSRPLKNDINCCPRNDWKKKKAKMNSEEQAFNIRAFSASWQGATCFLATSVFISKKGKDYLRFLNAK